MKTNDEEPDADRFSNSENKERSSSRSGKTRRFLPKIQIKRVDDVNDTIAKTQSDNKLSIFVIFEDRQRRRYFKEFVETCDNSPLIFGLGTVVVSFASVAAFFWCIGQIFTNFDEKNVELEHKRQMYQQSFDNKLIMTADTVKCHTN